MTLIRDNINKAFYGLKSFNGWHVAIEDDNEQGFKIMRVDYPSDYEFESPDKDERIIKEWLGEDVEVLSFC